MTKTQVEVITSVQRRRQWSRAEKERIVAAAIEPGAVASEVARFTGIHVSQLFRWRQQLCGATITGENADAVGPTPAASAPPVANSISMAGGSGTPGPGEPLRGSQEAARGGSARNTRASTSLPASIRTGFSTLRPTTTSPAVIWPESQTCVGFWVTSK